MMSLTHYLVLAGVLFVISIAGIFINRRNILILLMSIELMLLSVNINFIAFSSFLHDVSGQVFVFFILAVAAAEAAIGLAILVVIFRQRKSLEVDNLNEMKG
ncbi:MAG TPA: NADH-quinone oxidoreductase subunit NuoK [Oceanospirillales bacterium]|nr:NADH-quinone oxidoreductase subunit NuoK [Oceanospirillales bacterium]